MMHQAKSETDLNNDIIAMEHALPNTESLLEPMWKRFGKPSAPYLRRYCLVHKNDELVIDMVIYLWYLGWDFDIDAFCPKGNYVIWAQKYIFNEPDRDRNFAIALKLVKYCLINGTYEDMNAISLLAFMLKYGIGLPADPCSAGDWLEIVMRSNADSARIRSVAFAFFEGRLAYEGLNGVALPDKTRGRQLIEDALHDNLDPLFPCAADYLNRINGVKVLQRRKVPNWAILFNGGICYSTMHIEREVKSSRGPYAQGRVEDIGLSCARARCYSGFKDEYTLQLLKREDVQGIDYERIDGVRLCIKDERKYWIGWLYLHGDDRIRDVGKALQYLTESGNANFRAAQVALMQGYNDGLFGCKGDAVKWINKLAKEGDGCAIAMKGNYYREGYYHSEHNLNNAILCYILAAKKGEEVSMYRLALGFLFGGRGWTIDLEKGYYWLRQCLQRKRTYPDFNMLVGVCLYVGHGVRKDECEGRKYLEKAKKAGNPRASYILSGRYPIPRAVKSVIEWLEGKRSSYEVNDECQESNE